MTDRPIIMSGPMVRALLDGKKTMMRRLAWRERRPGCGTIPAKTSTIWKSVKPGDRLWCRETWGDLDADHPLARKHGGRRPQKGDRLVYRANPADDAQWIPGHPGAADFTWLPSIHMPRWASRLTLTVTATRMEPLQEISEGDARTEGVDSRISGVQVSNFITGDTEPIRSYRTGFVYVWQSLHTKPGARWEDNPEVVVISFVPHLANIDAMAEAA